MLWGQTRRCLIALYNRFLSSVFRADYVKTYGDKLRGRKRTGRAEKAAFHEGIGGDTRDGRRATKQGQPGLFGD